MLREIGRFLNKIWQNRRHGDMVAEFGGADSLGEARDFLTSGMICVASPFLPEAREPMVNGYERIMRFSFQAAGILPQLINRAGPGTKERTVLRGIRRWRIWAIGVP